MKELDVVEQITRRLGVTVDEIESYFVDWEGEQFPLIRFAQINQRTPEVLDSLLSNPIGTPICLIVNDVPSSPFLLLRKKTRKPSNQLISDYYYTVEAYYTGGKFIGFVEHVKGIDVLKAKRSLAASADEGERLRYTVLAEGAQPKVVSVYHGKRRLLW
jgi:hypothetical protein